MLAIVSLVAGAVTLIEAKHFLGNTRKVWKCGKPQSEGLLIEPEKDLDQTTLCSRIVTLSSSGNPLDSK